jgi:hypothetical protein
MKCFSGEWISLPWSSAKIKGFYSFPEEQKSDWSFGGFQPVPRVEWDPEMKQKEWTCRMKPHFFLLNFQVKWCSEKEKENSLKEIDVCILSSYGLQCWKSRMVLSQIKHLLLDPCFGTLYLNFLFGLQRHRQEDHKFETRLGNREGSVSKQDKSKQNKLPIWK